MMPSASPRRARGRSPGDQLPDLRVGRAGFADLGEDGDGLLEVVHGLGVVAGQVEEVGQVVVESGLAVAVALAGAELQGGPGVVDGAVDLAGGPVGQGEV